MSDETQQLATTTAAEPEGPRPDRWDVIRDVGAVLLLVVALVVPWNLSFGVGVPNSKVWLYAVVFAATVLSLCSLGVSRIAPASATATIGKVRLWLNVPYLLMVLGFLGFTLFESIRLGGDGDAPPGIGPGLLVGAAGALLAAQPALSNPAPVVSGDEGERDPFHGWFEFSRIVANWALFLAVFAVLLNFFWRTRRVFPEVLEGSTFWSSVAVLATAVAYGVVALIAVRIGLRWLQEDEHSARLAAIALGASTLVGSVLVWSLPIGRDVDAFHGIAQNTSTAGVGFEGYLAWAMAGAIFAPVILRQTLTKPVDPTAWREAARKCLQLIAFWCFGSAVLRVCDVLVALVSGLPAAPYDNLVLLAFDVAAGALAYWLRRGLTAESSPPAVVARLFGVLVVLLVCRVVVGVGLSRDVLYAAPPPDLDNAVYGNTLARQITSTFDVVLCLLGFAMLAAAVFALGRNRAGVAEPVAEPEAVLEPAAAPVADPVAEPEPEPEEPAAEEVASEPEPEPEPEPKDDSTSSSSLGRHRQRRRSAQTDSSAKTEG